VLIFFFPPLPFLTPTVSKKLPNILGLPSGESGLPLNGGEPPNPLRPLFTLSARLSSRGLNVPWLQGPACGVPRTNSNGFFNRAVASVTALLPKSPKPCVLPSRASSSAPGSVSRCAGKVFGEVSELLGAASTVIPAVSRVSSGEPTIVCASRKPLGVIGACWLALWLATEGFREWLLERSGEDGRREDMLGGGNPGLYLFE